MPGEKIVISMIIQYLQGSIQMVRLRKAQSERRRHLVASGLSHGMGVAVFRVDQPGLEPHDLCNEGRRVLLQRLPHQGTCLPEPSCPAEKYAKNRLIASCLGGQPIPLFPRPPQEIGGAYSADSGGDVITFIIADPGGMEGCPRGLGRSTEFLLNDRPAEEGVCKSREPAGVEPASGSGVVSPRRPPPLGPSPDPGHSNRRMGNVSPMHRLWSAEVRPDGYRGPATRHCRRPRGW